MGTKQKKAAVEPDAIDHMDDGHDHDAAIVTGTNHSDSIIAGGGPQQISTGNGKDTVAAGGGPDSVDLGNGKDTLNAQGGPDTASGGNAKDVIQGGCGPDHLIGGNGKDVIIGGKAADVLTGGRGPDLFVYTSTSDAPARGGGHGEDGGDDHGDDHGDTGDTHGEDGGDHGGGCSGSEGETITDFDPDTDRIDLSRLDGVARFAEGPAENAVWVDDAGGDAIVMIDTNGSIDGGHPAEMAILLQGVDAAAIDADCFLL